MNAMTRICWLLLVAVAGLSCNGRKGTELTPGKVREELLAYGAANPERDVLIETEYGAMRIRLYEETPLHRANFIKLINDGVLDDAEFYRIYFQFMIQAGIYPDELPYTLPAEFNTKFIHKKGALSMARADENNPHRESSSTEFFIVQGGKYADYQLEQDMEENGLTLTPAQREIYMQQGGYMSLDQQYTVFGEVVEGLDVIDKIAAVKVYSEDKPLKKIPLKISIARQAD